MNNHLEKNIHEIREGWDKAFSVMSKNGDDKLLDTETVSTSEWDETEWQWNNSIDKKCRLKK